MQFRRVACFAAVDLPNKGWADLNLDERRGRIERGGGVAAIGRSLDD